MSRAAQLPLALALLVTAALLGSAPGAPRSLAAPDGERALPVATPAAALLAPLAEGPRALLGLALWLTEEAFGTPGLPPYRREQLALALLDGAPDLERVRRELAEWYVIQRAPRERDAERHRALVVRGLALLEDGLARAPSSALHASFGALLAPRTREQLADPRRQRVAEQLFGGRGEDLAIESFRQALDRATVRGRLVDLLLDRGELALDRGERGPAALRDLEEAEALLRPTVGHEAERLDQVERLHELRARAGGDAPSGARASEPVRS